MVPSKMAIRMTVLGRVGKETVPILFLSFDLMWSMQSSRMKKSSYHARGHHHRDIAKFYTVLLLVAVAIPTN